MNRLRQAAARERRAPIYWWLLLMAGTGGALVWMVHAHSRSGALLLALLLAAAWGAPLVAFLSLASPRRATRPAPEPGHGSYSEWMRQARLLGRVLLYHEDNPALPSDLRRTFRAAREDLRDTFGAHPLRDDLERVCQRIREGAIRDLKDWFWRDYHFLVLDIQRDFEHALAEGLDEDERLIALQSAVEDASAMMTRRCMPRMLERERLICARDCAWLAAQASTGHAPSLSPIELAAALVVEWSDFSKPWQPARVLHRAVERMVRTEAPTPPAEPPPSEEGGSAPAPRKFRRVRVRVRKGHRHHRHHRSRGPSLGDVLLSFGQWVRYSVRAWLLYR